MTPVAFWRLDSPSVRPGAITVVLVQGDCDAVLERLGVRSLGVGQVSVREIPRVDQGVLARWSQSEMHLMPHGGTAVRSLLLARLAEIGVRERPVHAEVPAAVGSSIERSTFEARLAAVLSRAASPLAIDLLLDQWRRIEEGLGEVEPAHAAALSRLIEPPLIVACGRPNIGKSTLANALAGRVVSLAADEPGTTRDHVGFLLDLGGLVVRYVDAPGFERLTERTGASDRIDSEAIRIVGPLLDRADLVLWCEDARVGPRDHGSGSEPPMGARCRAAVMRVRLRADLASNDPSILSTPPGGLGTHLVSSLTGMGMERLVASIREALVGKEALRAPGVWPFWRFQG